MDGVRVGQVRVDGSDLPAAVVPAVTAPYRVTPAPRPLAEPPGVWLDDGWPAAVRRRLERLAADPAGVIVRARDADPDGVAAAVRAAWALLPVGPPAGQVTTSHEPAGPRPPSPGRSLADKDGRRPPSPGRSPAHLPHLGLTVDLQAQTAQVTGLSRCPEATELLEARTGPDLLLIGWLLACSDDLVVLHRTGDGELSAELLAVAFPSGWAPRRLAGASLTELHAPVAGNTRLQRAAPALSEALLTKGPLQQHVWGLEPSGRLDDDPSAPDVRTDPDPQDPAQWWLRVEQQTSVPLPHLDRALFLIRPHLQPLTALAQGQRLVLADAIDSMDDSARRYKGIEAMGPTLVTWLRG